MRWGTEMADQLGAECFVEGLDMGVGLYLHCGFEIIERVLVQPDVDEKGKSEEWKRLDKMLGHYETVMRRVPKAAHSKLEYSALDR